MIIRRVSEFVSTTSSYLGFSVLLSPPLQSSFGEKINQALRRFMVGPNDTTGLIFMHGANKRLHIDLN